MKELNQVRKQGGFTLIELMIVIAILAILMAIALPAYQDYTIRSQTSECMNLAGGARTAVAEFWVSDGTWPADNDAAGLAAATDISGRYVTGVAVDDGLITCTFGNEAHDDIDTDTLVLDPSNTDADAGAIEWTCDGGTLENKYRPRSCRT